MSWPVSRKRRGDANQERKTVGPAGEVLDFGPDDPAMSLAYVSRN